MKIVIDCDAGIDDAQAIMIALSHQVDVLAITCTFGNVDVDQVSKNVLKILDVCGRTDIPVYKGAHQAMLGTVLSLKLAIPRKQTSSVIYRSQQYFENHKSVRIRRGTYPPIIIYSREWGKRGGGYRDPGY